MSPSPVPDGYVRGPLFFDGSAGGGVHGDYARNTFWNLAGGYGARILVLTANAAGNAADHGYAEAFRDLEAAQVALLVIGRRASGHDPAVLQAVERSTAVFLSGGHPLQWSTRIGGTPLATAIRRANACGKAVGGVGGSAAFLGNHMLVYGGDFPRMAPGLGLSNRILVAAHFDPAQHGEVLHMAIASNPYLLGIGVPEQSACIRRPDDRLEAVGPSPVVLVDGQAMDSTNLMSWRPGMAFTAPGLRVVELQPQHQFDLETRRPVPPDDLMPAPQHSSL